MSRLSDFWLNVDRSAGADGCWPWLGAVNLESGYGTVNGRKRGTGLVAHRVAWEMHHGIEIPPGICILHHCDNPPCCNVERCLFDGTKADNNADMAAKGRHRMQRHPGTHAGERNPMAKLTDAQVTEIRVAYREGGVTQQLLALQYGVNGSCISRLVSGKRRPVRP